MFIYLFINALNNALMNIIAAAVQNTHCIQYGMQ